MISKSSIPSWRDALAKARSGTLLFIADHSFDVVEENRKTLVQWGWDDVEEISFRTRSPDGAESRRREVLPDLWLNWKVPRPAPKRNLPSIGTEIKVESPQHTTKEMGSFEHMGL